LHNLLFRLRRLLFLLLPRLLHLLRRLLRLRRLLFLVLPRLQFLRRPGV
jgi:hypothetical protein